ncbi:hypothetical protein RUM44_011908 [Polyplax serrata]|uniref:Uncharacterized protein n=1 Tax=Polyplax serrata TaxID=468196 RepID=A0ABR1BA65_POLSC
MDLWWPRKPSEPLQFDDMIKKLSTKRVKLQAGKYCPGQLLTTGKDTDKERTTTSETTHFGETREASESQMGAQ